MIVETVLAPNPGIYTGPGTNTYLISDGGEVAVLDPGPIIDRHRFHQWPHDIRRHHVHIRVDLIIDLNDGLTEVFTDVKLHGYDCITTLGR